MHVGYQTWSSSETFTALYPVVSAAGARAVTDRRAPPINRWKGERGFILAPGPSLTQADVSAVRGKGRVTVLNCVAYMATWADVLFSVDRFFWEEESPSRKEFSGERWTFGGCKTGRPAGLHYWNDFTKDVGVVPERLNVVAASGGTAISLTWLFGASPIVLLGYDMQPTGGRTHCHPDHPRNNPDARRFDIWQQTMAEFGRNLLETGAEVINCTRGSALRCFPRAKLEEVL